MKKRVCLGLSVLALLGLLGLSTYCAVRTVVPEGQALAPEQIGPAVRAVLRNGDWLVARGIHLPDNIVATATNMPLSHAAIYDSATDEVIEADSKGVHTSTLDAFLAKHQRVLVIRPMWSGGGVEDKAVQEARRLLGSGYNYTGLVGLGVSDRYYCTELAIAAYKPFFAEKPDNPIPNIIKPGQMYHWGRILFDSGP